MSLNPAEMSLSESPSLLQDLQESQNQGDIEMTDADEVATQKLPEVEEVENQNTLLKNLFKKTTKIFQMCNLVRVNYDDKSLKGYSKSLKKSCLKQLIDDGGENYDVDFKIIPGIKSSESDNETLYFEIVKKDEDNNPTLILCGILTSCGSHGTYMNYFGDLLSKEKSTGANLPVLCLSGPSYLYSKIQGEFEKMFFCHITPVNFSGAHLKTLFGIWIIHGHGSDTELANRVNRVRFKSILTKLDSAELESSMDYSIQKHLNKFKMYITKGGIPDLDNLLGVSTIWDEVLAEWEKIYGIDFAHSKTTLKQISTKQFSVSHDGKIKFISDSFSQFTALIYYLTWIFELRH